MNELFHEPYQTRRQVEARQRQAQPQAQGETQGMNRRDFLKTTAALAVCGTAPPEADALTLAELDALRDWAERSALTVDAIDGNYIVFIHPRKYDALLKLAARDKWRNAWKAYRIARAEGRISELAPQAVLAWYDKKPLIHGEVGIVEGIRIVTG